jgi:blue copper oxidase
LTGKQVNLGMAGAFIIRDAEEDALGLPSGAYEMPLIIRDVSYDAQGNIQYTANPNGFLGNSWLVNGTINPRLDVDTAVYRFRVLNGANARVFRLALSNQAAFTVIGNDGGLLEFPAQVGVVDMGSGERLDLIVDFRGLPVGSRVVLQDLPTGWPLLEFNVVRAFDPGYTVPTGRLSTIPPLPAPVRTRNFLFAGMTINGQTFDHERIDFSVPLGDTERWLITGGPGAPHPVHVHGTSFQVVARNGGRNQVFPWERGWKDTILLQGGETADVRIRFDAYGGGQRYVLHCHKLEHEDMGMMSAFEVV